MSKAVMLSIRPKWVEKIANGEKTIEVRKTRPNIATPFKCYIYCTSGNISYKCGNGMICHNSGGRIIIGEFLCKKIDRIVRVGYMGGMAPPSYFVEALNSLSGILPIKSLLNASCLMASREKPALHHIGIDVVIDMQRCIRAKHWTRWANCSFGWQSWRQM